MEHQRAVVVAVRCEAVLVDQLMMAPAQEDEILELRLRRRVQCFYVMSFDERRDVYSLGIGSLHRRICNGA